MVNIFSTDKRHERRSEVLTVTARLTYTVKKKHTGYQLAKMSRDVQKKTFRLIDNHTNG